jgi:hypothetical protein
LELRDLAAQLAQRETGQSLGSANPTVAKGQFTGRSESLRCTNAMPSPR